MSSGWLYTWMWRWRSFSRSRPWMYSRARKYSSSTRPKSNTGTMFEWTSWACRRAPSMTWLEASLPPGQVGVQPLHHEAALEALGPVGGGDVDLGHAALADALEQGVAAHHVGRGG